VEGTAPRRFDTTHVFLEVSKRIFHLLRIALHTNMVKKLFVSWFTSKWINQMLNLKAAKRMTPQARLRICDGADPAPFGTQLI
jgi:hypothetical protein